MTDQHITTSPHFDDFAPTLTPGQTLGYSPVMTGAGRWCVLVDTDETPPALIGVLWTNDTDALGLIETEASSHPHALSVRAAIDEDAAAGRPARAAFDAYVQGYQPDVYGEGDLTVLLDTL